jgi:2-polyprenyl-3-methyl-5-hydroxy-6-metoxy-1,4-benzoquinol methylase
VASGLVLRGKAEKIFMAIARIITEELTEKHVSFCILCSRNGVPLYSGLRDYTFGTAGSWDYRECQHCGLLWLSPRPLPKDMGTFYATYLTHQAKNDHAAARRLNEKFKLALWARAMQRPALSPNWLWAQIARVVSLDPFFRDIGRAGTMYLDGIKPGKVLDVGCGNGSFLGLMRSAGWDVAGLETDPKAAKLASERLGIPVRTGQLCQETYETGSFDAVTLHHVIEHVYDPPGLMAECRRILKPDGLLVVATPNLAGVGHRWFGANWRGLEPPRHLYLFTSDALADCARSAGIRVKLLRTSARMAPGIWMESRVISKRKCGDAEWTASLVGGLAFLMWERITRVRRKDAGEEILLVGTPA